MGKSFLINRTAKHRDNLCLKCQINSSQHKTAHHAHYDRIADAVFGLLLVSFSQTDAHKCTAAITNHDRDCQSNHREWKYNRIGRIAIRTKITGICNKDLIHNIIKCSNQKGDHTGQRILLHQFPNRFCAQILIGMFHFFTFSFVQNVSFFLSG